MDLDGVFWVAKAPVIEFREGNFHVCYKIGKRTSFEVVLSPSNYLKALRIANEAAAKWQVGDLDKVKAIR